MSRDEDFFDTNHAGAEIEINNNEVRPGQEINLMQKDPVLRYLHVGAGWDINSFDSDVIDVDLSLFLLDKTGKTRVDSDFVFYNQPIGCGDAVKHHGDSRTGAGDGDDETATIDLHGVPFDVMQIMLVLSLYKGDEKQQYFEEVKGAFVRICNKETKREIVRYSLDDDFKGRQETAIIVAELNREGPKWHFKPVGEFISQGLRAVGTRYGMIIADQ